MLYFHSWSGGKDSTAGVILDHIHGLPPSEIVISEVMFSHERNISGELPAHMDFINNKAIPLFQSWGYKVNVLRDDRDYLDHFHHIIKRSKHPQNVGKKRAFPLGGMCYANKLKMRPIERFFKQFDGDDLTQYVGIAIDEPKRLERLRGTNKVSLLEKYRYTEQMAYDLCKQYNLLSPIYETSARGGCWFCPNAKYTEFARLKKEHPELWGELVALSKEENLVSNGFKYGETISDVERRIDGILSEWEMMENQLSFFD